MMYLHRPIQTQIPRGKVSIKLWSGFGIVCLLLMGLISSSLKAQVTWNTGRYFPHFAEPDTVFVFPVIAPLGWGGGAWQANWRISNHPDVMHALTLAGMQGIINRKVPSVYLNWKDPVGHFRDDINATWAKQIDRYVHTVHVNNLDNRETVELLWKKYSHLFTGAVIYDPEIVDTINLATMIAALENRMILAPQQIGLDGIPAFQDVYDLRDLALQEGWDDTFDTQIKIYQWVYDNLWPNLEHRMIAIESPGPPLSGDPTTTELFPIGIAARDYMVALKLPVLYLNPKFPDHETLFSQFLADADSPIAVNGNTAFNEVGIVNSASSFGNFKSALNWPGEPISGGNYSVLSGVRPSIISVGDQIDENKIIATLSDNPVATIFISDGDALFFQSNRGFHGFFIWEDVLGQNFGWETNPVLSELAPVIWNYYQETRSGTSFLAGISGAGDIDLFSMSQAQRTAYLQRANTYFGGTGLRVARINGEHGEWGPGLAADYYDNLSSTGYLGTIIGFQNSTPYGTTLQYHNRPAPAMKPSYWLTPANKDQIVTELIAKDPNNELIKPTADENIPEITNVSDRLATKGTAMLIDQRFFYSQSYSLAFTAGPMTLMPGDYEISVRLKVTDTTSTNTIAKIYAGTRFFATPTYLGSRDITASEFNQIYRYQDFSFTISITELTHDLEVRLDYGDGSTDLYVDQIRITNNTPVDLPAYAPLYMSLAGDVDLHSGMKTLAGEFTADFESQGGLVLTADEFFASLNPEYMIDFAENYLGQNNRGLNSAKYQFQSGEYLQSLLTIRRALKSAVFQDQTPPEILAGQEFTIPESSLILSPVGQVLASDASSLTNWAITGGNTDRDGDGNPPFSIRSDTGHLKVYDPGDITFDSGSQIYELELTVQDSAGNTSNPVVVRVIVYAVNVDVPGTAGFDGWRHLATPGTSQTYASLLSNVWTQGATGASTTSGTPNVMIWDEAGQTYTAVPNLDRRIPVGQGFRVYLMEDDDPRIRGVQGGWPKRLEAPDTLNGGTVSLPVSYTNGPDPDDNGFNLVGNPFPISIDWEGPGWTKTNMNDAIYIWDPNANGGTGAYKQRVAGVGDPINVIAPFQGFWVQANAPDPVLEVSEDAMVDGGSFLKEPGELNGKIAELTLKISTGLFEDRMYLAFRPEGKVDHDPYDALQLESLSDRYLELYSHTTKEETPLAIQTLPLDLNRIIELPVGINTSEPGEALLEWQNPEKLPDNWHLSLKDTRTGRIVILNESGSYGFILNGVPQASKAKGMKAKLAPVNHKQTWFLLQINPGLGGFDDQSNIPLTTELAQNYPNPFNPQTSIRYGVPNKAMVQLTVFDILGRKVATLVNQERLPGYYEADFDARRLASGLYIYRLHVGGNVLTRKMMLIK